MKSVSLVCCLSGSFLNCSSMNADINEWDHRAYTHLVNVCVFLIDFFCFSILSIPGFNILFWFRYYNWYFKGPRVKE